MVRWHPSGQFLASGSYDNAIKIWKEDTEEEWNCIQTLNSHSSTVWALDFTSDGKHMISCSDDRTVKIWRINDPTNPKLTLLTSLTGYHDRTIFSVNISRDGHIATGCGDDGVRVFELKEGEMDMPKVDLLCHTSNAHASDVNCVQWNPITPSLLLSAGDDGLIRLWQFSD